MSQVVPFGATRSSSLRTLRQELFKTKNSSDVDRNEKRRRLQSEEWCVTFVCFASKTCTVVSDCGAKAAVKLVGLVEKKVTLKVDIDIYEQLYYICEQLRDVGGFELLTIKFSY